MWCGGGGALRSQMRGLRAKTHKTERDGSVLGEPCETTVEGKGRRWWDEVDKVMVAVGLCVRKREAGEGPMGQI